MRGGDRHERLVSAVTTPPIPRNRLFCGYTAGALSAMPSIFGLELGDVEEIECQTRGDSRCLYRVSWDPETATDPDTHARFLELQVASVIGRFEALEEMAAELASISDIDRALKTIARRAGVAIWAPQFILAVRLPGESSPRVHAIGLDDDDAARAASEILADEPDDHCGSRLVVDVASSSHSFGRLAALYPTGHRFLAEERRLLGAYAGHAASALATAAALEDARRRAATMGALFDFARRLSEVGTVAEVADRLVNLVADVVDCDRSCVFLWDPQDAVLVCRARSSRERIPYKERRHARSVRPDRALLARMARRPEPIAFGPGAEPAILDIAQAAGLGSGVLVPIVARHNLLGVLVTSSALWPETGAPAHVLRDALHGVASIAATALDSARLLDEVRHQASHDPLTGLPNTRLLAELATNALANARRHGYSVGVLFIDLDLFKDVNDERGHRAGDLLLSEVGARLQSVVRAGDTVARLGGDEFGVLLPHVGRVEDAEGIARRMLDALAPSFVVLEHTLRISASIGIAVSTPADESFGELLNRADGAMYEAKNNGRSQFRVRI